MPGSQRDVAHAVEGVVNIPRVVMNVALPNDFINICHLNAQSLCARQLGKLDEFRYCFINSKLDIICVSETWLKENISDTIVDLDGYKVLRNDRKYGRGGGVCIYFKNDIECQVIAASDASGLDDANRVEFLFIELHVNQNKFLLGVFYCPPGVDCSSMLEQQLSELSLDYENIVLTGDFNTNLNQNCPRTIRFGDVLDNFGFNCINNESTHFYQGGSSLIDLLLTNNSNFVFNFNQVAAPGFSQHDIIFASLAINRVQTDQHRTFRDYNRMNYSLLQNSLEHFDWSLLYSISDSDLALDYFNNYIIELYENCVPLRVTSSKPKAPWFNDDILNAMIVRNIAYSQWTTSKSDYHRSQYKRLRNKVNYLVRKAKSNYMCAHLERSSSSKDMWKKLKKIKVVDSNTKIEFDHTSDEINSYFGGNFTLEPNSYSIPPLNPGGFSFTPCNELDVAIAIFSISSNAVGLDGVPLKFIKIILPYVISPITYLFNLFIFTSKFPRSWKCAKVIPIRKKPTGCSLSNLRPISILCSLSKAFEKILKAQIQQHIQCFDLLSSRQSGFRSGHSTTSALLKVHDDIHQTVDKKGVAFLLLIDFSKAFDRVSHGKLLKKLSNQFYFHRNSVELIRSYLSLRTQVVDANDRLSSPVNILSGVPQGSVLGPLLFSLFINDLPLVLKSCFIHMFADDVQLYFCSTDTDLNRMALLINNDLKRVQKWSNDNLLPINPSKTKAMFVSRHRNQVLLPDLLINNEPIEYVDRASNLGIIFQNNLEWNHQVNSQCGKIYGSLRHLKLTAGILPVHIKIKLFKSLLQPHLSYGIELIINASAASLDRLRVCFNHCVRWVFNLSRYSRVTHLHRQLLGCSFYNYFKLRWLTTLYRIIHEGPQYLSDKLQSFRSIRVRHFVLNQHSTSFYGNTFFVRAIILWNQLPNELKSVSTVARFRRNCMTWLNEGN